MFERFFSKKCHSNRSYGAKLRQIRLRKGVSTAELGAKCNITDAAIRQYEGDKRTPKEDKLQEIANALGVDVTALYDRRIESIADIVHILFEVESDGYITPVRIPADQNSSRTTYGVRALNEVLSEALEKWCEKRELFEKEQISEEDYRNWQDAFPQEYEVEVHPEHEFYREKSLISDYRVHSLDFMKKFLIVMTYDMERLGTALEKNQGRLTKEFYDILKMNMFSWIQHEIEQLEQEPQFPKAPMNKGLLDNGDGSKN